MWMHPEDARSDFILAAAATLLGGFVVRLLTTLPLYPRSVLLAGLLDLVWIVALTALVPWLLARYRDHGPGAFALDRPRGAWVRGLVVAAPVVVVGIVLLLPAGGIVTAALGRLGGAPLGPTVALAQGLDALGLAFAALRVVVLALGALLLYTFLVTRARDAFRRTELSVTEALRTFGMGAAGVALLLALLRAITLDPVSQLTPVVGLAAMVLLTDRQVPLGATTSRATVLAPAIVTALAHLLGAGSFRGDILLGLYGGALGAGIAVVVAALVESDRGGWAVAPLALVTALYPTCLSPLAFELQLACG